MRITNKYIIIFYRAIFIILCGYGLYLNSGIPTGNFSPVTFLYYTILSNIMCFVFIGICLIKNITQFKNWNKDDDHCITPKAKGGVTVGITITFLIYHFMLVPQAFSMGDGFNLWTLPNLLVHYIVPIMVIADWLLFDKKCNYRPYQPITWLLIPFVYFVFAMVRGFFGGAIFWESKYPYFFLDADKIGYLGVFKYFFVLAILITVLGYIFYGIDRLLGFLFEKLKKSVKN
ncbi:MAG: Pr6Pr family membrane protein [Clostridiales bacterium]|nr:Pr6Pr family membrane protein [Clostridiales bacterium]